jgi:ribosomal protein S18 acetylase RimI-like enzyme
MSGSFDPGVQLAIEGNRHALRAYLARWPRLEVHHAPGLSWALADVPLASLNLIWDARLEPAEVRERAGAVLSQYAARSLPAQWLIGPATRPLDLGRRLETEQGLLYEGDSPGMALDLSAPSRAHGPAPDAYLPADLQISPLTDRARLPDWLAAYGGNGLPAPVGQAILDLESSLGFEPGGESASPYVRYIAYRSGRPLATATLFVWAGTAGLYNVHTLPGARPQGLGAALTPRALADAQARGCTVAVLAASPLGLGLYRTLGFREHCRFSHYLRPDSSA